MYGLKITYRANSVPTVISLEDKEVVDQLFRDILSARMTNKDIHVIQHKDYKLFIDPSEIVECCVYPV